MRVAAHELLQTAYGRYAVGAFNVCNLEQVHGLFRGAVRARAPVIVQFTRVMRDYAHPLMLEQLLRGAEAIYPEIQFAVHHDHGDQKSCAEAVASGHYSSVMIDASHLPFEQNLVATRDVVAMAHARGITVEAELGQLQGVEDDMSHEVKEAILTDLAARFHCKADELPSRVEALQEEIKKLQQQLKKGTATDLTGAADKLLAAAQDVNGAKIIVGELQLAESCHADGGAAHGRKS